MPARGTTWGCTVAFAQVALNRSTSHSGPGTHSFRLRSAGFHGRFFLLRNLLALQALKGLRGFASLVKVSLTIGVFRALSFCSCEGVLGLPLTHVKQEQLAAFEDDSRVLGVGEVHRVSLSSSRHPEDSNAAGRFLVPVPGHSEPHRPSWVQKQRFTNVLKGMASCQAAFRREDEFSLALERPGPSLGASIASKSLNESFASSRFFWNSLEAECLGSSVAAAAAGAPRCRGCSRRPLGIPLGARPAGPKP